MQILDCNMQDFTAEIHLVCVIHAKMADSELRAHILSRFWQDHQLTLWRTLFFTEIPKLFTPLPAISA